jgi:hypothetical protein
MVAGITPTATAAIIPAATAVRATGAGIIRAALVVIAMAATDKMDGAGQLVRSVRPQIKPIGRAGPAR